MPKTKSFGQNIHVHGAKRPGRNIQGRNVQRRNVQAGGERPGSEMSTCIGRIIREVNRLEGELSWGKMCRGELSGANRPGGKTSRRRNVQAGGKTS